MDCSRLRAPWAVGGGRHRGDETVVRILLLDVHKTRAQATGDGGCVARVEWSVEKARPQFGQRRDDIPRALPEVSTAMQRFISHKNICGDVEEAIRRHLDSKSRRVLYSRRLSHICRRELGKVEKASHRSLLSWGHL